MIMVSNKEDNFKRCQNVVVNIMKKKNINIEEYNIEEITKDIINISYAKGGDDSSDIIFGFTEGYLGSGLHKRYHKKSDGVTNLIDILVNEYDEKSWIEFVDCFGNYDVKVDGVPQNIINVIVGLLGEDAGIEWLQKPLNQFNEKPVLDLLNDENGEKALKAFIMRMPN